MSILVKVIAVILFFGVGFGALAGFAGSVEKLIRRDFEENSAIQLVATAVFTFVVGASVTYFCIKTVF